MTFDIIRWLFYEPFTNLEFGQISTVLEKGKGFIKHVDDVLSSAGSFMNRLLIHDLVKFQLFLEKVNGS